MPGRRGWQRLAATLPGCLLIAFGLWQTVTNSVLAANGRGFRDFERHWVVFQYIRAGQNPYAIALAVLRHGEETGWTPPAVLSDARAVPGWEEVDGVRPDLGPPETNYPPSAILFFTYTVGLLPAAWAASGWTIVNLLVLEFLGLRLVRQAIPSDPDAVLPAALTAVGVILLWPPTQAVLFSNQVTLFAMACVLLALDATETSSLRAGFWFALALYKPSASLLFLIYPLVRGRFRVIAVAGLIHLASLLALSELVGAAPQQLLTDWLEHSRYYVWRMYSVREFFARLGPGFARFEGAAQAGLLAVVLLWCWRNRSADLERLVDFLCFATFAWVGHGNYDFVFLLLPLMHALRRLYQASTESAHDRRTAALELAGYVLIAAGLTYPVYYMSADWERLTPWLAQPARTARWLCRLSLGAMFAVQAARLRPRRVTL